MDIEHDRQSWLAGFVAGEAGKPASLRRAEQDVYSWHSGWAEGDAKRQGREYSLGALTPVSRVFSCRDSADAPDGDTELSAGEGVTTGTVPVAGKGVTPALGVGRTTLPDVWSALIIPPGATNEASVTNTAMPEPTRIFLLVFISGSNLEGEPAQPAPGLSSSVPSSRRWASLSRPKCHRSGW